MTVLVGDCLAVMPTLEAASVDAIVTDPPYGLEFMGKEWDSFAPARTKYYGERADTSKAIGADDSKPASRHHTSFPMGRPTFRRCAKCKRREFSGSPCRCDSPDWLYEQPDGPPTKMVAFSTWCEAWAREALRVAKPGAHLVAFGGTRTHHRLMVAIEDAGWEIRDCLMWLHGVGFPKSHNLDRTGANCACDDDLPGMQPRILQAPLAVQRQEAGLLSSVQRDGAGAGVGTTRVQGSGGPKELYGIAGPGESGVAGWGHDQAGEGELSRGALRQNAAMGEGNGSGGRVHHGTPSGNGGNDGPPSRPDGGGAPPEPRPIGQPTGESGTLAVESGAQTSGTWPVCGRCGKPRFPRGLGTALKPAWEPIILARKPLDGTVAANVAAHGTGGLNIDGCRIDGVPPSVPQPAGGAGAMYGFKNGRGRSGEMSTATGRWPANVVLDEDAAARLDAEVGELSSGANPTRRGSPKFRHAYGAFQGQEACEAARGAETGGPSRFYYTAKASRSEREAGMVGPEKPLLWSAGTLNPGSFQAEGTHRAARNNHPTVKPLALMRWLCRLVTPPGGLILDPFTGSGSTGCAAALEGFRFTGIEQSAEYAAIAEQRIRHWTPAQMEAAL